MKAPSTSSRRGDRLPPGGARILGGIRSWPKNDGGRQKPKNVTGVRSAGIGALYNGGVNLTRPLARARRLRPRRYVANPFPCLN